MGSAFEALKGGRIMPDLSRLVTIPSLDDPTTAPTGCSTLYVLEPVPHLDGKINWSTEAKQLRGRLHTFLATQGYPSEVITEQLVTPLDWRAQSMAAGTPFALADASVRPDPSVHPTSSDKCRGCSASGRSRESVSQWC
jgi:phytoene desaturase